MSAGVHPSAFTLKSGGESPGQLGLVDIVLTDGVSRMCPPTTPLRLPALGPGEVAAR